MFDSNGSQFYVLINRELLTVNRFTYTLTTDFTSSMVF
jgi:hypothetical protein